LLLWPHEVGVHRSAITTTETTVEFTAIVSRQGT
jgi:hypothetical protein